MKTFIVLWWLGVALLLLGMIVFFKNISRKNKKAEEVPEPEESCECGIIPIRDGAVLLPYVYYPQGQSAVKAFKMGGVFPGGITYKPRSDHKFDNIAGFKINENLTVLRYWGKGCAPGDCHRLAKEFGGRIPTEAEFLEIVTKLNDINASLASIDEETLYKGHYLVVSDMDYWVINIEDSNDRDLIEWDDGCCFIVVK